MVVAAILANFPGRLFHRSEPLKAAKDRGAMPGFSLPDLDGRSWSLKDHQGEVVLLNFWATWCPPCREETPELVELQARFASRGFTVVGVNMDDDPKQVAPDFVRRFKMTYPVLVPNPAFKLADYIESLPTTFLIDRNGRVARTFVGQLHTEQLNGHIETLLSESSARQQASASAPRGY